MTACSASFLHNSSAAFEKQQNETKYTMFYVTLFGYDPADYCRCKFADDPSGSGQARHFLTRESAFQHLNRRKTLLQRRYPYYRFEWNVYEIIWFAKDPDPFCDPLLTAYGKWPAVYDVSDMPDVFGDTEDERVSKSCLMVRP